MGRSDPNSQIDLAHLAIWARRAPPGPATYLPHPTNGCPAWPSSQGACGKPGFAQGPLSGREIARDAIWGNLGHMGSMMPRERDNKSSQVKSRRSLRAVFAAFALS